MTVGRLLAEASSAELTGWMAFHRIEPFESDRADLRAAIVAHTVASVHHSGKGRRPKLEDFLPKYERRTRRQSPGEMASILKAIATQKGGKVIE